MGARVLAATKRPTCAHTPECLYPQPFGLLLCMLFPSNSTARVPGDHFISDTSGKKPINLFVVRPHHEGEACGLATDDQGQCIRSLSKIWWS